MSRAFDSVLIANRGEIALRIMRTAKAEGYRTIAVYSEVDAQSPHVLFADEAVLIGPAPVAESYLNQARILAAAGLAKAGAIHPGYGFLSENAEFAQACAAEGIVFIGPSPAAIAIMGNKAVAKRRMLESGVPCVPGYQDSEQSDEALTAAAAQLGFPLMVKAAAGGGGRGMRFVAAPSELASALSAARSEAQTAFGSAELILEKAVLRPRHVEIQVFGDSAGNVIHLGERDCSVQRRHQKVVEESPCPVLSPALRTAMGEAAVAAARSIEYLGAGTVEFLLDAQGNFYFLEMNTRLQVEHPVTEMVTGCDLVAWQLAVAQGATLPLSQDEVRQRGHAIEVRLYAEDTGQDFLPASGTALAWNPPVGEGIRVDHGLLSGQVISPFYDPMMAKLIAYGEDRETARRRLLRALRETVIFGIESNREFLIEVLARPAFIRGEATTAFIAEEFPDGTVALPVGDEQLCFAALLQYLQMLEDSRQRRISVRAGFSAGSGALDLRSRFAYATADGLRELSLRERAGGCYELILDGEVHELELIERESQRIRVVCDALQCTVSYCFPAPGEVALQWRGRALTLRNELAFSAPEEDAAGSGAVTAPMHGNLARLMVALGDSVSVGDELAVMEAMKMEHRLLAGIDGTVAQLYAREGDQLAAGALVLEIAVPDSP
ncbi:MAG: geranyl-CoA carboxylase alpha subunit [Halieaceae bacterium]|jgi:geranyl-CoA carboxylase alpha subunit